MKINLFSAVAVCLFLSCAAFSQSVFQFNEKQIKAFLEPDKLQIQMLFENSSKAAMLKVSVEIVDPDDVVVARTETVKNVGRGNQTVKIPVAFDRPSAVSDALIWDRLRYKIEPAENADFARLSGTLSLSEIMPEIFEIRAVGARQIYAGMFYSVNVRAFQPVSGAPAANVKISGAVELDVDDEKTDGRLKLNAQATTKRDGYATLKFVIPAGAKLDEDGEVKLEGEKNGITRRAEQDLDSFRTRNYVYLNTDKPIYQPGQDFHVRGFSLAQTAARTSQAVREQELEFVIEDEDETTLYRETVKTSRFGIAAIDWKIPENAKLGTYRVKIKADDDDLDSNQINFKVSRYELPNFTVNAKPDQTYYLPDQKTAEITVSADYLFGKKVARGTVKIVRETDRHWNYVEQKYESEEAEKFAGAINADGVFTAQIDLTKAHAELHDSEYRRFDDLHYAAYLTDATTNRTEQKRFDVRVSKEAVHVYIIGNNRYSDRNPKLPVSFYVSTFYADGAPAECRVEIKGKDEAEAENAARTLIETTTNRFGAGKISFIAPRFENKKSANELQIKVFAADAKNLTGTQEDKFSLDDGAKQIEISTAQTVYKNGEAIEAEITTSENAADVFVEVVKDYSPIETRLIKIVNGRAVVKIPYRPAFKGEITVAAYFDKGGGDAVTDAKGIVFPAPNGLELSAEPEKSAYRPGEEATVNFNVAAFDKNKTETALGVVVFDKAIDERAKTDAEFGGDRTPNAFGDFARINDNPNSFGAVTLGLLNRLDLKAKIPADLQLAAEILLADRDYSPDFFESGEYGRNQHNIFEKYFAKQFDSLKIFLENVYAKDFTHPTDENSLNQISAANAINFADLRDPWAMPYLVSVETEREQDGLYIRSSGADKIAGSSDDFIVLQLKFNYFTPLGNQINRAIENYHQRTGEFVRDYQTLRVALLAQNVDLDRLKDRFGRAYQYKFAVDGRFYTLEINSDGKDGKREENYYNGDDFTVWTNRADYFADAEAKIQAALSNFSNEQKSFPRDAAEFKLILQKSGVNFDDLRDGDGHSLSLQYKTYSRYADKVKSEITSVYGEKAKEKLTISPVTQTVGVITVRSPGADHISENADDEDLATFSGVLSEQSKDDAAPQTVKTETIFTGGKGAIRGTVMDETGAVIPGAIVTATDERTQEFVTKTTDDNGFYLLGNLPTGVYSVKVSVSGFQATLVQNVPVRASTLSELNFTLKGGAVTATVDVTAEASVTNTTNASISSSQVQDLPINGRQFSNFSVLKPGIPATSKNGQAVILNENSTPRLREYFPETLLWKPEIAADKNGRAQIKFKLGDNITTWKVYAIATDTNGKVGLAEREIQAFQPFFVDLDPPKILTVGDEIYLPAQIRNYTEILQRVDVSMARADWFAPLGNAETQRVEVAPNETQNAVFGFRADSAIKAGKQQVTALAGKESDAIEKTVAVHPNGKEIVRTTSEIFRDSLVFDSNFPADALPKTANAELKIYPNLLAHVAESIEGLLKRPYGCGEQTISSTYPNLLILKTLKNAPDSKLKTQAQKYLQSGYERLLGYQKADGGFAVWTQDESDVALTAYALRFLAEASEFIEIDDSVSENAAKWLAANQRADGSWTKIYAWEKTEEIQRTKIISTYVTRSLALAERINRSKTAAPILQKAFAYLKDRNQEIDEPYALANFALALLDVNDLQNAAPIIEKLEKSAIPESERIYWNLETNTPFYGWGTSGRIETTALVVQALNEFKVQNSKFKVEEQNAKIENLISGGTVFLLKNKDRYGVWHSTQATINVLDAMLSIVGEQTDAPNSATRTAAIFVNGAHFKDVELPAANALGFPLTVELPVADSAAKVEIKITGNTSAMMAQIVQSHYVAWVNFLADGRDINQSRQIRLDYKCDKLNAKIMDEITCAVEAERVGFRGYGMLLAEIGVPPGADVDRASLEKAKNDNWNVSRYEVLPDKIIFYLWASPGGVKFDFKFHPRYAINANAAPSVVYDYYNEEAKATLAPLKFTIK